MLHSPTGSPLLGLALGPGPRAACVEVVVVTVTLVTRGLVPKLCRHRASPCRIPGAARSGGESSPPGSGTVTAVTGRSELVHGVELFGVCLEHPDVHPDQRGSFAEVYSADRPRGLESRQWSVVTSAAGSLRGMHLHLRHDECVSVITGEMAVGLYDLQYSSSLESEYSGFLLPFFRRALPILRLFLFLSLRCAGIGDRAFLLVLPGEVWLL